MLPGLILILVGVLGGLGAAGIFGLMLLLCGLFAGGCVGVWLEYGFLMTPYILSENPTMKAKEALSLSRQMMQGHKFNAFVLSLSFIGWEFLGLLLCGIGILFVQPYVDATFAELYAVLREPYRNRLSGYGYEEYNGGQGMAGTREIIGAKEIPGIRAALRVIPGISRQKELGLKPRARAGLAKRTARRAGTAR